MSSCGLELPGAVAAEATRAELLRAARTCYDHLAGWLGVALARARELHVAGGLGAALASRFLQLGWLARRDGTRAVLVTDAGRAALERELGVAA